MNLQNALGNASHLSDHNSDGRKAEQDAAKLRKSQRLQWSQRRKEQAEIAGERTPASLRAEIEQRKSIDAARWRSTGECDPLKITAGASREFCAAIASLQAKYGAALERDKLDAEIAKLDAASLAAGAPPASLDPFADTVAQAVALFGGSVSDAGKLVITASKDWIKAIVIELMATFGPSAVLALCRPSARREDLPAETPRPTSAQAKGTGNKGVAADAAAPPPPPSPLPLADPLHGFIALKLERCEGAILPAGAMWTLWRGYCSDAGLAEGTQRAFGLKMKQWFAWERNSNRPRYLNVRAKGEAAGLRLAVNNA
jgi:hypothetical protein